MAVQNIVVCPRADWSDDWLPCQIWTLILFIKHLYAATLKQYWLRRLRSRQICLFALHGTIDRKVVHFAVIVRFFCNKHSLLLQKKLTNVGLHVMMLGKHTGVIWCSGPGLVLFSERGILLGRILNCEVETVWISLSVYFGKKTF